MWLRAASAPDRERVGVLVGPGEPPKVAESAGAWTAVPSDTMDRQLISNGPAYAAAAWRGPYLATATRPDPWGNRYIAAVGDPAFVVSAGPNGTIDTSLAALASGRPAEDDIVAVVGR
jgi:hypothetical protein